MGPTRETRRCVALILSSEFFSDLSREFGWILEELRALARRWFTARRERGEKSKITPEALSFPSTRRGDNVPPLRFVDGWATDAARRKIERNKKNARPGDGRGRRFGGQGGGKSEKSLDSRRGSINFIFIIDDCVSLSLFFLSLFFRHHLFGICYRASSMQPMIIITVLRLCASEWFVRQSLIVFPFLFTPFVHPSYASTLCAPRETGFRKRNKHEYSKRNTYLKYIN